MKYLIITAIFIISCGTNRVSYELPDTNFIEVSSDSGMDDINDSDSFNVSTRDTNYRDTASDTTIYTDTGTELGTDDTESETETDTESSSEFEWDTSTDTGDNTDTSTETDTEEEEDSESESGTFDTDTGSDVDTDSYTDTGIKIDGTDTGMDTGTETESSQDTGTEDIEPLDTDTNPTCTVVDGVPTGCPTGLDDIYHNLLLQYIDCVNNHCVLKEICPDVYNESGCRSYTTCGTSHSYPDYNYRCETVGTVCCHYH